MKLPPRPAEPGELIPTDYFQRLTPAELFTTQAPLEVDLGCGDGALALGLARQFPERNFLAVERLLGRVRKVCRRATNGGLQSLRVLRLEARYTVEWLLPHSSVSRLHLLFPDPWPKARHHRRRLVQGQFLLAVHQVLVPGGEFLFKTDDEDYFEWAQTELSLFNRFEALSWKEEDFPYPQTDFEARWRTEGREVFQLRVRKPG